MWDVWHKVGGGRSVLQTDGRWAVGLNNRCDVGLVGGELFNIGQKLTPKAGGTEVE